MTINWQLRIKAVEKEDEGIYECQVPSFTAYHQCFPQCQLSTSPQRVYRFELKVSGEIREILSGILMGTLKRATIISNV